MRFVSPLDAGVVHGEHVVVAATQSGRVGCPPGPVEAVLDDALHVALRDAALVLAPDGVPGGPDQEHGSLEATHVASVALVVVTVEVT